MPTGAMAYRVAMKPDARATINKIRLADAVICGESSCETIFSFRERSTCPSCGGKVFASVARWLQERGR